MRPSLKNLCIFQKKKKRNKEISLCIFHQLDRLSGTIRPLARFLAFYHRVGRLEQLDHFFNKNKSEKKEEEGFSRLFFFTKLTIQSQKKMNFLMPLYRKHLKEGQLL
jgi:hypothetical protein